MALLTWWYIVAHRQPSANRYHGLVLAWVGLERAGAAGGRAKRPQAHGLSGRGTNVRLAERAHLLGIVAAFAIFYHSGLRTGGPLSAWLLTFFSLTVVSGLMGWWFPAGLPPLLTAMEENPAILEDLLMVRARMSARHARAGRRRLARVPRLGEKRLMTETTSWSRMFRFYRRRSTLAQELPAFQKEHGGVHSAHLKRLRSIAPFSAPPSTLCESTK